MEAHIDISGYPTVTAIMLLFKNCKSSNLVVIVIVSNTTVDHRNSILHDQFNMWYISKFDPTGISAGDTYLI